MKVYVATNPNKPFESEIPDDVRAACDVEDLCITTNAEPYGHSLTECARHAQGQGLRLMVDGELERTALDNFIYEPAKWEAARKATVAMLKEVRGAFGRRRKIPVGVYTKAPSGIGLNRYHYTFDQWLALLRADQKAFATLIDYRILEAYMSRTVWLGDDAAALATWQTNLDAMLAAVALQGAPAETMVLCSPWVETKNQEWVPASEDLWRWQLEHLGREGLAPLLFNPDGALWDVTASFAVKDLT